MFVEIWVKLIGVSEQKQKYGLVFIRLFLCTSTGKKSSDREKGLGQDKSVSLSVHSFWVARVFRDYLPNSAVKF